MVSRRSGHGRNASRHPDVWHWRSDWAYIQDIFSSQYVGLPVYILYLEVQRNRS